MNLTKVVEKMEKLTKGELKLFLRNKDTMVQIKEIFLEHPGRDLELKQKFFQILEQNGLVNEYWGQMNNINTETKPELKKLTLKEFSLSELKNWYGKLRELPKNELLKEMNNERTWDRITWYLEWLPIELQRRWTKKIKKLFGKNKIDIQTILRQAALKNHSKIIIFED